MADFLQGLIYDTQLNHQESARILEQVLHRTSPTDINFLADVYYYYLIELQQLGDTVRMHQTLGEWRQSLSATLDSVADSFTYNLFYYRYYGTYYRYSLLKRDYREASRAIARAPSPTTTSP